MGADSGDASQCKTPKVAGIHTFADMSSDHTVQANRCPKQKTPFSSERNGVSTVTAWHSGV